MKITCDACAAKYSIADEKIAGRTVRVRCKKCASSILVRGDDVAPGSAASWDDAPWHLVIDGEPRGSMSADDVAALLRGGDADDDTLVWREGYADWDRLGDDPELASLVRRDTDAVATSATRPAEPAFPALPADGSLTGARNDSSVLFSLSNLQALSEAPRTAPAAPAAAEASGLIDIRALAAAPSPAAPARAPLEIDELLPFGSASPLGAPVVAPEPERTPSRAPIVAGVTVALAAIAAAAVAILWIGRPHRPAEADPRVLLEAPATEAPATAAPGIGPVRAEGPAHVQPPVEEEAPEAAPTRAAEPQPVEPQPTAEPTARRAPRRPAPPARQPAPRPERAPVEATPTEHDPIASILEPRHAPARPAPARPTGPQTPSRADVVSAMNGVASAVRACGDGAHGMVTVRVVFTGRTGRVTGAEVRSGTVAPPVRSCVARAVRAASVPAFTQPTFSVTYPFRL